MEFVGNDGSSVKTGCELLIKILDAILQQPDEQKYVRRSIMLQAQEQMSVNCRMLLQVPQD